MKVKMKEVYQGRDVQAYNVHEGLNVSIPEKGEVYEVNQPLGVWLVENGKAEEIKAEEVKSEEIPTLVDESPSFEKPQRSRRSK